MLKRFDDAVRDGDCVRALILGSAVNDGRAKLGFTAMSVDGQAPVLSDALAVAGIDPAAIDYIEGRGTATLLGDLIEVQAIADAFTPEGRGPLRRAGQRPVCSAP